MHNVANAHAFVGAPFELRQIVRQRIIEAADQPLLESHADQDRGHGLSHGKRNPARIWSGAKFVVFKSHLAILEDKQASDAIVREVVEQVELFTPRMEMNVLYRCR